MGLEYACFLSYRHGQPRVIETFLQQLVDAIDGELQAWTHLRCFVDKERLRGGSFYNDELSGALCQSACLVPIYTPLYFSREHPYCAREYRAMERLEERRLPAIAAQLPNRGLIIPVVPRGWARLPGYIGTSRHSINFEKFALGDSPLDHHPNFRTTTRQLADDIRELCDAFSQHPRLFDECGSFALPTEDEVQDLLAATAVSPLRLPSQEV